MESLYRYLIQALEQSESDFVAQHRHLFLLKPPAQVDLEDDAGGGDFEDDDQLPTRLINLRTTETSELRDERVLASEWSVTAVRKASEFPPYNRIVVGRSRVSDVVLPFPSVSKSHAVFHVESFRPAYLSDLRSANGTFLNGRRLQPDEVAPVRVGDRIRLGRLEVELVDAARLYAVVRR